MAHSFEVIESKICTNKSNTDLMRQICGRYADIVNIWEEIGFDQNTINNRIELLQIAILGTLNDINEGEIDLYNKIKESIDRYKKKVNDLKQRLNVDISPLMARLIAQKSNGAQQPEAKYMDTSLGLDQSLMISKQTNLLEEDFFYKSLAKELDKIREERKQRYTELKRREESLAEQLDETFQSLSNKSVLDESDLKRVEEHVGSLNSEKEKRIELIRKFHETIVRIAKENQIEVDVKSSLYQLKYFEDDGVFDFDIDSASMDSYRKSMDKLIEKRDELVDSIDAIRHDISYMWTKFDIRNEAFASFLESPGEIEYTQNAFQLLLDEYSRCVELKKFKLQDVITQLRNQINIIWRKIVLSPDEIFKFEPIFNETQISEELLAKHEAYLNELTVYSKKYQAMFELIQEWTKKWSEHVAFEKEYSDPTRFSKKTYSPLFEERERKKIDNELNKLESRLEKEAQNYFNDENKHFKYAGTTVLAFVKAQKEKFDSERENTRKQRQSTKKAIDHRKEINSNSKVSTPTNNLLKNKHINVKTPNSALNPGRPCLSKTPANRRTDTPVNKEFKTPRSLTVNRGKSSNANSRTTTTTTTTKVAKSMMPNIEPNKSKKRISFTDLHKLKRASLISSPPRRRSKSNENKQKLSAAHFHDELNGKENVNFDTILGGHYKYKGKSGNVSSGIESIVSFSELENPACNSSFNF